MRYARLFLPFFAALACGCSCMIAGAGKDLGAVDTRAEMHGVLGEPVTRGVANGEPYEEFHTRMVIRDDQSAAGEGYALLLFITCGTSELVTVPYQLGLLCKRSIAGQTVRVTYDKNGNVTQVDRDGESVLGLFKKNRRSVGQPGNEILPVAASDAPVPMPASP
jgi:YD repeat-containing protein